jgi:hypothetical protein
MCEIADESMYDITPSVQDSIKNNWQDIGWYTDENGYKRFGVIPQNIIPMAKWRY